jgi:hypothetical protein
MVKVYFEGKGYASLVAIFQDEFMYNACLPALQTECKRQGYKYITESVEENEWLSSKGQFPNGFTEWHETHYEIVQAMTIEWVKDKPKGIVLETQENAGHGGLYDLAFDLTNKFEKENVGKAWGIDEEFFDAIEKFTNQNLK